MLSQSLLRQRTLSDKRILVSGGVSPESQSLLRQRTLSDVRFKPRTLLGICRRVSIASSPANSFRPGWRAPADGPSGVSIASSPANSFRPVFGQPVDLPAPGLNRFFASELFPTWSA